MFASPSSTPPLTPQPSSATKQQGDRGEDLATQAARALGWKVLARNHGCRSGEIDLVASHGSTLVFVEVKARRIRGHGFRAVNRAKRRRLVLAALDYAAEHKVDLGVTPCRFDVCEVLLDDGSVRWLHAAFSVDGLGLDL